MPVVLKTTVPKRDRGFESHLLRSRSNMEKVELNPNDAIYILASCVATFLNHFKADGIIVSHKDVRYNIMAVEGVFTVCKDEYPEQPVGQMIKIKTGA